MRNEALGYCLEYLLYILLFLLYLNDVMYVLQFTVSLSCRSGSQFSSIEHNLLNRVRKQLFFNRYTSTKV
jgi:hypothetical protein